MIISIICPLFHGNKFIEKQKENIENAAMIIKNSGNWRLETKTTSIELLFINDDPGEIIPPLESDFITIKVFNTTVNRGIQGARIWGLEHANGEYVHFLDQDDEIAPGFYYELLSCIDDADVVYCRCIDGIRPTYTKNRIFETSAEKDNILSRPPMISPGQAIIRKKSIPEFWKTHVLENMGSDDYFLWLCMFATGCKFKQCDKLLFRHVRTGGNYSMDIVKANLSDKEMAQVLIESDLFNNEDKKIILAIPDKQFERKYKAMLRSQKILYTLEVLLKGEERNYGLAHILSKDDIKSVAIYGAAIMGERIKDLLSGKGVDVAFYIDKNAEFIKQDIPVYNPNDIADIHSINDNHVDAIIVSFVDEEKQILSNLSEFFNKKIYCISVIAEHIYEKLEEDDRINKKTWGGYLNA